MSITTLEERIAELELQVAEMRAELQVVKDQRGKDWRRTVGAFTDDDGVRDILREAMRLRELERAKARSGNSK